ncbi:PleD family two-component system response regulator [Glaciecola siphonariae]|uniref:PleD family two-component system response regulator n=1 Tax=Glaciecola siphonariae TaxID=521012 RepID=A0ABV9LPX0_9ALTE
MKGSNYRYTLYEEQKSDHTPRMQDPNKLLKSINILVVDDMEAIRSMIKACLRQMGATRVIATYNGDAAWHILEKHRVDMIVCDWDMPKVTGIELLQKVRSKDTTRHIPFLMLTASIDKKRVLKAVELGVNDYLSKPFQPKELEYRVLKLLRKVNLNPIIPEKSDTQRADNQEQSTDSGAADK